jgi:hypothetical protein
MAVSWQLIVELGAGGGGKRLEGLDRLRGHQARFPSVTPSSRLASVAASLVEIHYGWNLDRQCRGIPALGLDFGNVVQEFQSPSFRSENMLQFEALLLIGAGRGGDHRFRPLEDRRRIHGIVVLGAHGAGQCAPCSHYHHRNRADPIAAQLSAWVESVEARGY